MIEPQKEMFDEARYYRADEIARMLSVSKRTVYRMMNDIDNPLPASRVRGCLRVKGTAINEYLERNKKDPVWE